MRLQLRLQWLGDRFSAEKNSRLREGLPQGRGSLLHQIGVRHRTVGNAEGDERRRRIAETSFGVAATHVHEQHFVQVLPRYGAENGQFDLAIDVHEVHRFAGGFLNCRGQIVPILLDLVFILVDRADQPAAADDVDSLDRNLELGTQLIEELFDSPLRVFEGIRVKFAGFTQARDEGGVVGTGQQHLEIVAQLLVGNDLHRRDFDSFRTNLDAAMNARGRRDRSIA